MSDHPSPPSPADVARIAAMSDRVIRNLEITECYARLSSAMRTRVTEGANWCTFATWASRQAGSTIRGEDLLDRFERRLGREARLLEPIQSLGRRLLRRGLLAPQTRLGRLVAEVHTPFDAFERASEGVAKGNLKVFEEIGREFARYLATVPVEVRPDSPEFTAFAAGLRPGPPPDGQDLLVEAFTLYQQHAHETGPAGVALGLLANLKIGLHEQTRLQPQIAEAVDAPLTTARDLGERVLHVFIPSSRRWHRMLRRPAASMAGWLAMRLRNVEVTVTREVVTESMMALALPTVVLALGRDLDAPVPPALAAATVSALDAFVTEHDPCPPGGIQCGARDWTDLPQRMHYILHLFRAYAVDPALFGRPFTDAQIASFRAGIVPDGVLSGLLERTADQYSRLA
jgi:hypothetical protein